MKTVIIDYNMGNVRSVSNALASLDIDHVLTREPEVISEACGLILPGVGAFGDGVKNLREFGLIDVLRDQVLEKKKPILGICVGMQLMADGSDEHGPHEGLGFIHGWVKHLDPQDRNCKVPHVGWNDLRIQVKDPLYTSMDDAPDFYFVHSYAFEAEDQSDVSATCNYGTSFAASVQKENIIGVQFHPEKSQKNGISLLRNFVEFAKSC
jgi:imidazole glycerol-phosphate synthase subunit HisH